MKVPVYDVNGEVVDEVELPTDIFGIKPNVSVMHQALVRQQANARQGTHKTKTRGEVAYSGRKIWRQKGTGRARHGSRRAPIFRGGGVVFGPNVRSHRKKMPRKMRRLALRSALSVKAAESQVVVIDQLAFDEPRTREMVALLNRLGLHESVLIAMDDSDWAVEKSASNLGDVKTLRVQYLNVADLLGYDYLLLPRRSLEIIRQTWGKEA
jgi:large subunit ribosomal protein L4